MSVDFVIAQLSDPHIGADWGHADPAEALAAAVDAVRAIEPAPDAVLVSGDLAEHAADAEYQQARALLERTGAPLFVLPGNHDDSARLRHHFATPGVGEEPVQYAADFGPLRLVALDTTGPTEDTGALGPDRLNWLDTELGRVPDVPTLIAMHHPPVLTGIAPTDASGLPASDRVGLAEVVARHPQVRLLTAGHAHRTITTQLAGRPVLVVPSTYVQARLDLEAHDLTLTDEPAGFVVHALLDDVLVSHVQPVP